jgi:hypothetical protein
VTRWPSALFGSLFFFYPLFTKPLSIRPLCTCTHALRSCSAKHPPKLHLFFSCYSHPAPLQAQLPGSAFRLPPPTFTVQCAHPPQRPVCPSTHTPCPDTLLLFSNTRRLSRVPVAYPQPRLCVPLSHIYADGQHNSESLTHTTDVPCPSSFVSCYPLAILGACVFVVVCEVLTISTHTHVYAHHDGVHTHADLVKKYPSPKQKAKRCCSLAQIFCVHSPRHYSPAKNRTAAILLSSYKPGRASIQLPSYTYSLNFTKMWSALVACRRAGGALQQHHAALLRNAVNAGAADASCFR